MTNDRLPNPSRKLEFITKMGSWLLVIPSSIVGILFFELFCKLFFPSIANTQGIDQWYKFVVFFDGRDTIFQNHGDIFTFVPDSEIKNLAGFIHDDGLNVVYDYHFRTNNFGLVQDTDITPERESLLLLGDSFTEGQGAEPWFRLIIPEIDKLGYQPINGGLRGTGFEQWLKLTQYLTFQNVRIRKLVVLFISDDYQRPVWNFNPATLQCLSALPLCRLEESYFYRFPPHEELSSWLAKIRTSRGPMTKMWLKARAQALLPVSYHVFYRFYTSIGRRRTEQQSRSAIAELIKIYRPENVAFIHLPQQDEIDNGPNDLGLKARGSIQEAGGKLFDGFKLCRLMATDYGANDGHPNSGGYAKIAACVTNVINEMTAGTH
jgi:hypothetical protein